MGAFPPSGRGSGREALDRGIWKLGVWVWNSVSAGGGPRRHTEGGGEGVGLARF
jgi:hypothetical protein